MAVGPSNNLLSALSQLQGSARPPASQPRPPQQSQNSFAAQLGGVNAIRANAPAMQTAAQVAEQPQTTTAPAQQSRPIPARGGYLGQYVNIVV
ncbi:MAG: hypothetical protein ACK4FK_17020 [Ferrovibrio sp.]|jgi:hypothetical protein|uniref:hypothetical protein n=1 Tax=Ferrovibrio sp. TaxID=1917215 RepID=UPI0039199AD3